MREILFRGKPYEYTYMCDEETPKWVFGNGIYVYKDSYNQEEIFNMVDSEEERVEPIYAQTVGQYTGLNDRNGVKIFDGDICTDGSCTVRVGWYKHGWYCEVIKGETLSKGFAFPLWQWDRCRENGYRQLEVIGNIHDNPEWINNS